MDGLGSHRTLLSQAKPMTGSWPQPRTGYQARQQNRNQHRSLREEPRLREGNRTREQGGRFCHVKAGRASEPRILAGRDLNLRFLRPGETLGAEGKAELQEVTWGCPPLRRCRPSLGGSAHSAQGTTSRGTSVWPGRPPVATGSPGMVDHVPLLGILPLK